MSTIAQLLARSGLPLLEARMLLEASLGRTRAWLIAHQDEAADAEGARRYADRVARRRAGEPVAYILGEREFYGLQFALTPAVLIPRPETELLVELALQRLPEAASASVVDLGTGSGVIAVTIAKLRPRARVSAVDADARALELARANAARHGVQVAFHCGDWAAPLAGQRFDVLVSNPPYVAANDPHLLQGDLRYEPRQALVGGADGLDCIRRIARGVHEHLQPGGWALIEHGHDQAEACRALFEQQGLVQVQSWADLAGLERVSGGRAPSRR